MWVSNRCIVSPTLNTNHLHPHPHPSSRPNASVGCRFFFLCFWCKIFCVYFLFCVIVCVCVCVCFVCMFFLSHCVCVFIKLHITAQSGRACMIVFVCMCFMCLRVCVLCVCVYVCVYVFCVYVCKIVGGSGWMCFLSHVFSSRVLASQCIGERNIMFFYIFLGCLLVHVVLVGALALVPSLAESL